MVFGFGILFTSIFVSGSLYYYATTNADPQEIELLPLSAPVDFVPQLFISPEIELDLSPSLADD